MGIATARAVVFLFNVFVIPVLQYTQDKLLLESRFAIIWIPATAGMTEKNDVIPNDFLIDLGSSVPIKSPDLCFRRPADRQG